MQYAVKRLEAIESILKELLEHATDDSQAIEIKEQLNDIQNAILVLNATQPIVNIGQIMALKNLQK